MVVHVLVHGLPICKFSYELPCNWPMGHKWVRADEHNEATCRGCKKVAEAAFPPKPEEVVPPPPDTEPEMVCSDDDGDWEYGGGWGGYI